MSLQMFVGTTTTDEAFFQELVFEIEANREEYLDKNYLLLIEELPHGKIFISELRSFKTDIELGQETLTFIKKRRWCEIEGYRKHGLIGIHNVRLDLTTQAAQVFADRTFLTRGCVWDPNEPVKELTPQEIREAIQDINGAFQQEIETQSKLKRAV